LLKPLCDSTRVSRIRFRTDKDDDDEAAFDPMRLAAALEDKSSHPLGAAIVSGIKFIFSVCKRTLDITLIP
jgi:cation transport ATPase